MSLGKEPEVTTTEPVDIHGSLISTLARDPPKRVPGRQPIADSSHGRRGNDESEDKSNPPTPAQGPAPLPGGSNSDPPIEDNDNRDDEDD